MKRFLKTCSHSVHQYQVNTFETSMDEKLQKSKDFLSGSYALQFAKTDLDSFPSVFQRRKEEGGLMLRD